MESQSERKPKLRRAKNFVVEENIDAIRWPQECSICGGVVEQTDNIKLQKKYKTFGKIKVEVADIPYCQTCLAKSRTARRLDTAVWILTLLLGIPLGFVLLAAQYSRAGSGTGFIWLGLVFAFDIAVGYGLVWLVVKLPITTIFRERFVKPIDAWLIEEKKSDGKEGLSVVIAIPNKNYADKFGRLNGVAA